MKFKLTLKDPDGVGDSLDDAVERSLRDVKGQLVPQELEALKEKRRETFRQAMRPFVEFSEYVTIEIDTNEMTARVVPVGEKA